MNEEPTAHCWHCHAAENLEQVRRPKGEMIWLCPKCRPSTSLPRIGDKLVYITSTGKRFWATVRGYHKNHTPQAPLIELKYDGGTYGPQVIKAAPPYNGTDRGYFVPHGPKTIYQVRFPTGAAGVPDVIFAVQSSTVVEIKPRRPFAHVQWALAQSGEYVRDWYLRRGAEVLKMAISESLSTWLESEKLNATFPDPQHIPPPPPAPPPGKCNYCGGPIEETKPTAGYRQSVHDQERLPGEYPNPEGRGVHKLCESCSNSLEDLMRVCRELRP